MHLLIFCICISTALSYIGIKLKLPSAASSSSAQNGEESNNDNDNNEAKVQEAMSSLSRQYGDGMVLGKRRGHGGATLFIIEESGS
ncbi:uncharacterized protein LODBEIA_P52700 [Lodderomyces beijingensis]|uniref:Uncharacterized protein n=1 Tax=Lodderomyces beijingensis TaxID=1775926 RepID=A0ABP0ZV54_9ASCO